VHEAKMRNVGCAVLESVMRMGVVRLI